MTFRNPRLKSVSKLSWPIDRNRLIKAVWAVSTFRIGVSKVDTSLVTDLVEASPVKLYVEKPENLRSILTDWVAQFQ